MYSNEYIQYNIMKNKKRKDCKYYVCGKCGLSYSIHGYGLPFNSRKYGWMWKCCDYSLGKPCEDYKPRITKTIEKDDNSRIDGTSR